jgi:hypothetical protein
MKSKSHYLLCLPAAALLLLAGCATRTASVPVQSGFLTRYDQLQKVDETTSRYVDAARLRTCKKFTIKPVQVLAESFGGKPLAADEGMAADYVAMALVKALSDRYPITVIPGADVGVLRIAITGADKKGTQLGLKLEGEVLDPSSNAQVAALMKSEISAQHDRNWSYRLTFRQMANAWAADFRRTLDKVQSQ